MIQDLWTFHRNAYVDHKDIDNISWKTTVGLGDFMYGLNIAYMRAFINQKPTKFQVHHFFPEHYYYHYEDPESVDEREKFVKQFYMFPDLVQIEYIFDSQDTKLYKAKYFNVRRTRHSHINRYWSFDPSIATSETKNKVVLWRPTFNLRQQLSGFKMPMLDHEWARLIDRMRDMGYDIVEIDYRTPIREVFYHIRTCQFCLSYEGMWHYIAKNFFKPHIVFSDSNITKWHTPAALNKSSEEFFIDRDFKKIPYWIDHAEERAYNYKQYFFKFINGW